MYATSFTPWHLDILDQINVTLDMQYNPLYDGAGVDIYILDTGTLHVCTLGLNLFNMISARSEL